MAKLAKSSSGGDPAAERRLLPNRCLTRADLPKPFQWTLVSFLGYGVPLLQCIIAYVIAKSICACSAYFTANCKNVSRIFSHLTSILYMPQSTFIKLHLLCLPSSSFQQRKCLLRFSIITATAASNGIGHQSEKLAELHKTKGYLRLGRAAGQTH